MTQTLSPVPAQPTRRLCIALAAALALAGLPTLAPAAALEPSQMLEKWRSALVGIQFRRNPAPTPATGRASGPRASAEDPQTQEFLRRLIGDPEGRFNPGRSATAINSGLLISPDGWVLSTGIDPPQANETATVHTDDGQVFPAQVMGFERSQSLLLLKIQAPKALPYMQLEQAISPALPKVGERVVALGRITLEQQASPAVTEGLVSAVFNGKPWQPRTVLATAQIVTSMGGGPLISLNSGQVLAFCGQHYRQSSTGVTVTAAQPAAEVLATVRKLQQATDLTATHELRRAWMGISTGQVAAPQRQSLSLDAGAVLVVKLDAAGPAERAGFKPDDIVTHLDGVALEGGEHLVWLVQRQVAGQRMVFRLLRAGQPMELPVQLEWMPARR